ncbi:MAG: protein kinase domain-containing protein [Anaerolineae bacterium]
MLNTGDMLQDRYRIVTPLGEGGMGAVYRAWDTRLSIPVALKEMFAQPDLDSTTLFDLRSQFQQEAVVLARLSHPHLVGVTDFFQEGRNVYLVMKFVEGDSLADYIRQHGAVSEEQAVLWMGQLLDALGYCHSQGVIHRDIKPQNIIIRPDGSAVLVDFGLVKLWDPHDPRTRTAVRGMGTPQYAPPEQYDLASGHTEPRSDLYSLGATMYHALTGQAPASATMRIAAPEEFVPLRSLASRVSSRTSAVIERAMELARSRRWETASEMANALGVEIRNWASPPPAVEQAGPVAGHGGTVRMSETERRQVRRRVPIWLLGVLGLFLLGGGGAAAIAFELVDLPGFDRSAILSRDPTSTPEPTATPVLPTATIPPTAKPTQTWTPTVEPIIAPTRTVRPTSTPKGQEDVAASPTATTQSGSRPTSTPEAATKEPTPTATQSTAQTPVPTATQAPPASTGALVSFETWGTWRRGEQPYGELNPTQEQVKAGSQAAKLTYNFPSSGDDFVVFVQPRDVGGRPNTFAAWVYGDGSGHFLNLWVEDAQDEMWSVALGRVGGSGWRQMVGNLAPGLEWPSGHVSGPDNGVVDYPVRFHAMVLDRPGGQQTGTIYIDEITAWSGQVAAPTAAPTSAAAQPTTAPQATATTSAGGSTGEVGRILFTVQTADGYYLYSTDPGWSQMAEVGRTDFNHSTCSGTTVSTLDGRTFNVYGDDLWRCGISERTDACTSPDENWQLITNFQPGWTYAVLLKNLSDDTEEFYYQGKLQTGLGIQWSTNSQYVYFGVDNHINVIRAGAGGYQQAVSAYTTIDPELQRSSPHFVPGGTRLLYLKPAGGEGNSDIFIVNVDGSGERNLTNAPAARKLCPRWRR